MRGYPERIGGEEPTVLRYEIGSYLQGTAQVSLVRGLLPSVQVVSRYSDQVRLKTVVFGMRRILVDPQGPN